MKITISRCLSAIAMIAVGLAFLRKAILAYRSVEYAGDGNLMAIEQVEAFCIFGIPAFACFALAGSFCFYGRRVALKAEPDVTGEV